MRFVKAVGVLVVVLLLCVVAMYAMGSHLPVAHTATATAVINAPQAAVWQKMEDVKSQPQWRKELNGIDDAASQNGHPCWTEVQKHMRMLLCEDLWPPSPVTRIVRIADPTLPFGGLWTYELQPIDAAPSRLTITENGTTGPAMWRFLGHYAFHEDTSIKLYESELQQAFAK